MQERDSLIDNPVSLEIAISKKIEGKGYEKSMWKVEPLLTAFRVQEPAKNIVFVIDCSDSMSWDIDENLNENNRMRQVKVEMTRLLGELKPQDQFCIVSFNNEAHTLVTLRHATKAHVESAQEEVGKLTAKNSTNFRAAFEQAKIAMGNIQNYNVVFLTDGRHDSVNCSPDFIAPNLDQIYSDGRPRIIPIGIYQKKPDTCRLLNEVSSSGQAIFIENDQPKSYTAAFDQAWKSIASAPEMPAQLEMSIEAKEGAESALFKSTTSVGTIPFNSTPFILSSTPFPSPLPPQKIKLRITHGNTVLKAEHKLTDQERSELGSDGNLNVSVRAFKYKDNSLRSWMFTLGSIALGVLLVTGFALYALPFMQPLFHLDIYSSLALKVIDVLLGAGLLLGGTHSLARKTLFLPTKPAYKKTSEDELKAAPTADIVIDADSSATNKRGPSNTGCLAWLPSKKFLERSSVVAAGGVVGYFSSKLASANPIHTLTATGTPSPLFAAICTISGAVMLPILVYYSIKAINKCSKRQSISQTGERNTSAAPS